MAPVSVNYHTCELANLDRTNDHTRAFLNDTMIITRVINI